MKSTIKSGEHRAQYRCAILQIPSELSSTLGSGKPGQWSIRQLLDGARSVYHTRKSEESRNELTTCGDADGSKT